MPDHVMPLDTIAAEIKARWKIVDKVHDHRIAISLLLREARDRVAAGEASDLTWSDWCSLNVKRSERDIRKVLALTDGTKSAAEKLADQRAAAAKSMAASRSQQATIRSNVGPAHIEPVIEPPEPGRDARIPTPKVGRVLGLIKTFTPAERCEFDGLFISTDVANLENTITEYLTPLSNQDRLRAITKLLTRLRASQ
jgi:hypothetical protein